MFPSFTSSTLQKGIYNNFNGVPWALKIGSPGMISRGGLSVLESSAKRIIITYVYQKSMEFIWKIYSPVGLLRSCFIFRKSMNFMLESTSWNKRAYNSRLKKLIKLKETLNASLIAFSIIFGNSDSSRLIVSSMRSLFASTEILIYER